MRAAEKEADKAAKEAEKAEKEAGREAGKAAQLSTGETGAEGRAGQSEIDVGVVAVDVAAPREGDEQRAANEAWAAHMRSEHAR